MALVDTVPKARRLALRDTRGHLSKGTLFLRPVLQAIRLLNQSTSERLWPTVVQLLSEVREANHLGTVEQCLESTIQETLLRFWLELPETAGAAAMDLQDFFRSSAPAFEWLVGKVGDGGRKTFPPYVTAQILKLYADDVRSGAEHDTAYSQTMAAFAQRHQEANLEAAQAVWDDVYMKPLPPPNG